MTLPLAWTNRYNVLTLFDVQLSSSNHDVAVPERDVHKHRTRRKVGHKARSHMLAMPINPLHHSTVLVKERNRELFLGTESRRQPNEDSGKATRRRGPWDNFCAVKCRYYGKGKPERGT